MYGCILWGSVYEVSESVGDPVWLVCGVRGCGCVGVGVWVWVWVCGCRCVGVR